MLNAIFRKVFPCAVWGTPHGGLVRREGDQFIFIEVPPGARGYKVGDTMPTHWPVTTHNVLAMLATEAMIAS